MITDEYEELVRYSKTVLKCFSECKKKHFNCDQCTGNSKDLKIRFMTNFSTHTTAHMLVSGIVKFELRNEVTDKELFALQFEFPDLVKLYKEGILPL